MENLKFNDLDENVSIDDLALETMLDQEKNVFDLDVNSEITHKGHFIDSDGEIISIED